MDRVLCFCVLCFFLVCGCSKQDCGFCDGKEDAPTIEQIVVEIDPLVQRFEAGDWDALDLEYKRICNELQGKAARTELVRLHKRALAVDFKKIEDRVRREWVDESEPCQNVMFGPIGLPRWTEDKECNRVLALAHSDLGDLTERIGSMYWLAGDYGKEMWDVWFDYIEKMIIENQRLKRDRFCYCEWPIQRIEECRSIQFGDGIPQLEKEVDDWLKEKFLRIVGRPMRNPAQANGIKKSNR